MYVDLKKNDWNLLALTTNIGRNNLNSRLKHKFKYDRLFTNVCNSNYVLIGL